MTDLKVAKAKEKKKIRNDFSLGSSQVEFGTVFEQSLGGAGTVCRRQVLARTPVSFSLLAMSSHAQLVHLPGTGASNIAAFPTEQQPRTTTLPHQSTSPRLHFERPTRTLSHFEKQSWPIVTPSPSQLSRPGKLYHSPKNTDVFANERQQRQAGADWSVAAH